MTQEDQVIRAIAQRAELTLDAARRAYRAMQSLADEKHLFMTRLAPALSTSKQAVRQQGKIYVDTYA